MENMISGKQMIFFVAVFALAFLAVANVSAFGTITSVQVHEVEALNGAEEVAAFAGETLPVRIIFEATENATDVIVKALIAGDREYSVSSDRFDVDDGKTYSRLVNVKIPFDLDPTEDLRLQITVESKNDGEADSAFVSLGAQRESYIVEVLDVDMNSNVKAGETLALDVVLKNRGRQEAEDTFVRASIPALGLSDKGYFGDLSAIDQNGEDLPEKFDSAERRLLLRIPSNAPAGVYTVEVEAYNGDSITTLTRKVAVDAAGQGSMIVSPTSSKTIAVGETGRYTLTVVNSGDRIAVYELVVSNDEGLNVEVSEPVFAVPAGMSKTVEFQVMADKANDYRFSVDVHSDGQLVTSKQYSVKVEGTRTGTVVRGTNATVLLTVILAIVFVVLLVVLIVLLTRKPQKSEEFGESYY